MKIALTGATSTGKTTLLRALMQHVGFRNLVCRQVGVDARGLLEQLGFRSMDLMSEVETRNFQRRYCEAKLSLEAGIEAFITDRSLVDVAAYWLERDAVGVTEDENNLYVEKCRHVASTYDLHIYLPFGAIPFRSDGYRSENLEFHMRICARIRLLLDTWNLRYVTLHKPDLLIRMTRVLQTVGLE